MVASFHDWCSWPCHHPEAVRLALKIASAHLFSLPSQAVSVDPRDFQASRDPQDPQVTCSRKQVTSCLCIHTVVFLSLFCTPFLGPLHSSLPWDVTVFCHLGTYHRHVASKGGRQDRNVCGDWHLVEPQSKGEDSCCSGLSLGYGRSGHPKSGSDTCCDFFGLFRYQRPQRVTRILRRRRTPRTQGSPRRPRSWRVSRTPR